MEQKKTISELYQECKLKHEMEQKKKELMEQIAEALYGGVTIGFGTPPIPPIPQSFQGKV